MENREIELRHIQLELQNGRTGHFRSFIDQWFCYKNGYINRNGNANWHAIIRNEYVSEGAMNTSNNKLIVRKEHIVPLNVIGTELLKLGKEITLDEIESVLDDWLMFATILRTEDLILNSKGLRKDMPEEFYTEGHELYRDKFARYKKSGIDIYTSRKP